MDFENYSVKPSQKYKVRFVQILLIALSIWFYAWGYDLSQTYGLSPGDGGVLKPELNRYAFAAVMWLMASATAFSMIAYTRLYVTKIRKTPLGFQISTLGFFTECQYEFPSQQVDIKYFEGQFRGRMSVNAPWWSLHVEGRKFPFIIDAQV